LNPRPRGYESRALTNCATRALSLVPNRDQSEAATACGPNRFVVGDGKKGVQGESNSRPLRPERRIMPLDHAPTTCTKVSVLGPGIEPGTYCVLGSRHNQLDHSSTNILGGTRTPNLEIRSLTPYPVRPRGHISVNRPQRRNPIGIEPQPPKWFPDRDLNPGLNGESVVS
jgi:hypothetical protein